ncbi:LacI family DNA-binding transcriptional regulator [Streptomonospora halophila]|uniref:LacI family DNA-binding transcriptional regulator n=1 Tax=Streptomonospora halophila TaxID=427369 RepID=A0ABP9GLM0_9ACTN
MDTPSSSTPVTLEDVARRAGVSPSTASRALNGSSRKVRGEYQVRVHAAAVELGYIANTAAQAVARGRSEHLAMVVNGINDDYFSPVAAGVLKAAEAADRMVTMISSRNSAQQAAQVVSALRSQRPRAIILAGGRSVASTRWEERLVEELAAFQEEGGRVVAISEEGMPFDTVSLDNVAAAADLAGAMAGLGYRRVTILGGPADARTAHDRVRGFVAGLAEHGVEVPPSEVLHCGFDRDGGYSAAGECLRRRVPAELVLAISDTVAVGAIARFREAGMSLPADMAVAGIDDVTVLRDVAPALTTVRLPWPEAGRAALDLALRPTEAEPRLVRMTGHVVLRESTPGIGGG